MTQENTTLSLTAFQLEAIEVELSSLQISYVRVRDVKRCLHKYLYPIFDDLMSLNDEDFRLEATGRMVRLILAHPNACDSFGWRKLLLSDPVFKWMNGYPVVQGYHKYCSLAYYHDWENAEPNRGFVELFTK